VPFFLFIARRQSAPLKSPRRLFILRLSQNFNAAHVFATARQTPSIGMWYCQLFTFLAVALLVTIWSMVLYQQSPPAQGVTATHPCNKTVFCQYDERVGYDTSWICCEDGNGWPATHIMSSMALMLLSNNFWFSMTLTAVWEVVEAFALEVDAAGLMQLAPSPAEFNIQLNTSAGQLLGRYITLDLLGILIGVLLINFTGWRGLSRRVTRFRAAAIYWVWALVTLAVWLLPFLYSGKFYYGFILAVIFELLIIIFIWPWVFRITKDDLDKGEKDPQIEYASLRWWWFVIVLAVGLTGPGYTFLFNAIYQAWLVAYAFLAILLVLLFIKVGSPRESRARRRNDRDVEE
jgi:hypothetical protein